MIRSCGGTSSVGRVHSRLCFRIGFRNSAALTISQQWWDDVHVAVLAQVRRPRMSRTRNDQEAHDDHKNDPVPGRHLRPVQTDYAALVQIVAKTIGVGGAVATVGYISLLAHQELLGIQSDFNGAGQISIAAATFSLDTLQILLRQGQVHWYAALGIALLFVLAWWAQRAVVSASSRYSWAIEVALVAVPLVTSSGALVLYELPTFNMKNLMVGGVCVQPFLFPPSERTSDIVGKRTNQLLKRVLDSRGEGYACPGVLEWHHENPGVARRKLRNGYALTLTAIIFGWYTLLLRLRIPGPKWHRAARMCGLLGLVTTSLLVPNTYGKIIASTEMPFVRVYLRDREKVSNWLQGKDTPWLLGDSVLVEKTDKRVVLFNVFNKRTALVEIPYGDIRFLQVTEMRDPLGSQMQPGLAEPPIIEEKGESQ